MTKRIRLIRGWMTDLKELREIRKVKRNRPPCTNEENDGNHAFIEYWSKYTKRCHDCSYEEELKRKD